MSSKDVVQLSRATLLDIDLYLKALSALLHTLRLDLENSLKALGAAEESMQKSLGAIEAAKQSD